jgi:hydroxymethylbilane synthase
VSDRLRIGTRGSRLALVQSGWVEQRLRELAPGLETELVVIRTSGDRIYDVPLAAFGGKGLFVKEIEAALAAGEIDCAVHSLKDLPGELLTGLEIAAVPRREDARDVVVTRQPGGLAAVAAGGRVGTSSPRRAALLGATRPDLEVVNLRGNVETRLRKLAAGEVDATLLAAAGLNRLGIEPEHRELCDPGVFLPAVGQGALALEVRRGEAHAAVAALDERDSRDAIDAERGFLCAVGGTCVTPLAGYATVDAATVTLRAAILHPSGAPVLRDEICGPRAAAWALGEELASRLLSSGGARLLREIEALS